MHPALLEKLAGWHAADMRAAAGRSRGTARTGAPRLPVRQRAGWLLVQVGLRLALG